MIARSVPRKTESNAPIDRSVENYEIVVAIFLK